VVLRRICEFLGIDRTFSFPAQRTTFNKSARDGQSYRLLQALPLVSTLARKLPLLWRRTVRNSLSQAPPELPRLEPAERAALVDVLADDLVRLRDDYGFDTSAWPSAGPL
jgi:hypothetical protein